jgi:hypothetical protein
MLKVGSIWCGWVQHVTSTGLVFLPHDVNISENKSETLYRAEIIFIIIMLMLMSS